jgi:CheY-like chemotaxis protein
MDKIRCILLVDDDQITNFANELLLEDLAVAEQVLVAHNGQEALQRIRQGTAEACPELILLDINMPVMNGFEFLKAYEGLDAAYKQSVVILMLTTSMNPGDLERLKQVPIQGLLNKPLTEEMVRDLLRQHFNRQLPA